MSNNPGNNKTIGYEIRNENECPYPRDKIRFVLAVRRLFTQGFSPQTKQLGSVSHRQNPNPYLDNPNNSDNPNSPRAGLNRAPANPSLF